ncbi:MAG: serine/threonine-protein phosphatase [Planctomycetes bacterium]|nr:serine/threonine-protein phosphatase [Planctomycetota bacterium]
MSDRKRILAELKNNPAWQMVAEGQLWLCPFCGQCGSRWQAEQKEMLPDVERHLQEACSGWQEGAGAALALEDLKARVVRLSIARKISTDPQWKVIDGRGTWYCPRCGMPTRARFDAARTATAEVLEQIRGHMAKCKPRHEGALVPVQHLVVAMGLFSRPEWQGYTKVRLWVCPFCLKLTKVEIGPDMKLTSDLVSAALSHLAECYPYKERSGNPHTSAAVEEVVRRESRIEEWRVKAAVLMENNPVWSFSVDGDIWVCPYCKSRVDQVRFSSPFVRRETCPGLIAAHLVMKCPSFFDQARPAESVEELGQALGLVAPPSPAATPSPAAAPAPEPEPVERRAGKTIPLEIQATESSNTILAITHELDEIKQKMRGSQDMERDLAEARRKQLQMLPALPKIEGFEFLAVYRPCASVGGDFYDFVQVSPTAVGVVVGDVSGHGMDAAIVMSMAKKLLNIYAKRRRSSREVLSIAHEDIRKDLDRRTFVTVFYGILDTKERTLNFARAGHNPLLVYNEKRDPDLSILSPRGMALGVGTSEVFEKTIEESQIALMSGDCLLLHTDGVTEATNPAGEEFGLDRLAEVVRKGGRYEAEYLSFQIETALSRFVAGGKQEDDVTIVICRVL